ncbi:protein adenylyltransferase Fic-like [Macrosteles quadrilineatus]|uniref:protein adenylyltransferase Fic-like n=1 Tax=Macrosteles quadrilineatus TaxID=74068 RepID=UPI0023E209CB|nr:protein adenylyltransferase Fic-like [Macrosteles quadrilineatus]
MVLQQWFVIKGNEIRSVCQQASNTCSSLMMNDVRVMKAAFLFVFILGIVCSVFLTLFLDHYRTSKRSIEDNKVKVFLPYPSENHMVNHPDNPTETLELSVRKADVEPSASTTEALSSLQVALELRSLGKIDKAMKLLEHALALAPNHPDILNHYGEMVEEVNKDIIKADQMYFQALMQFPEHRVARANRQRVKRAVEELDGAALRRIDNKRDTVASIPDSNPALRRAKREAYFQHIYHTVGIEGNTMTLSQTRSIVETRMAVGGKSIMEHNEILGLDAAMKYINSTLINKIGSITVEDILEIHKRVLGFVDPEESGMFRRTQVYVGGHIPPRPRHIPPLMEQFVEWLNSDAALRLHPVQYAALAHYKMVHIHPFNDGNGRTSRLLMNLILMQAGFPPVIVLKQNRHRYYKMLELANGGDVRPFIRFIAESTEQTLDLFLWATEEYSSDIPAIESSAKTIIVEE